MAKCSQCSKPAVVSYGGFALCVEHHLKMQQAVYLQIYMLSKHLDFIETELEAGTGGLIQRPRVAMAPPPDLGNNFTLNNINVTGNNVTVINARTIRNLDASITVMQSSGEGELASAVKELTQALVDSKEIDDANRNEIAELLEFLVSQATAEAQDRSMGVVGSVLSRIPIAISMAAGLLTIWDKLEPLLKATFGI